MTSSGGRHGLGSEAGIGTAVLSRAMGALYLCGAVTGGLSLTLPTAAGANRGALLSNVAVALVAGLALVATGRRLRPWMFHGLLAAGTVLITRAIYYSGSGVSYYSVWYVWVALYAFYFFGRRAALAHMLGVAVAFGVVLSLKAESAPVARWMTTVTTVLIAGVFVDALVSRVRREKAERLHLLDRLEQMASTDELTGLPNRRACHDALSVQMAAAQRGGWALSVAMLDLDGFKALNDTRGHLAGDQLLKQLASAWSGCMRGTDLIARYGGDEFVLVLPRCRLDMTGVVLDRLREVTPEHLAFSCGVAEWDGEATIEATIAAADARLYEAKRLAQARVATA